jgi:predicted RNA-binding Zn-ribbon protein involved in translation (DUF1610 family)
MNREDIIEIIRKQFNNFINDDRCLNDLRVDLEKEILSLQQKEEKELKVPNECPNCGLKDTVIRQEKENEHGHDFKCTVCTINFNQNN